MTLFEEQLQKRSELDKENIDDAISGIAEAVTGESHINPRNLKKMSDTVIKEILRQFKLRESATDTESEDMEFDTVEDQLSYYLVPYGIHWRDVKLAPGWYKDSVGIIYATRKGSEQPVLLIPGAFGGYIMLDPAVGEKRRINSHIASELNEEAIVFYEPFPQRTMDSKSLFKFMANQIRPLDVVLLVVATGIVSLLGLLPPIFRQLLTSDILKENNVEVLLSMAVFMLCFSVSKALFNIISSLINANIGLKVSVAVQAAGMGRLLSLPVNFFKNYSSGDMAKRMEYLCGLSSTVVTSIGTTMITTAFSLIYLFQVHSLAPALVGPAVIILIVTTVVNIIIVLFTRMNTKSILETSAKTSGMTYSMITGMQKIRLAGAQSRLFARWGRVYAKEAQATYNPPLIVKLSSTITLSISLIGNFALYFIAHANMVSVSDYYAFSASFGAISAAFASFAAVTGAMAKVRPTIDMIRPILEAVPELSAGREKVTSLSGRIELHNVYFRYGEELPYVIKDLSLTVNPGEYLAVVGYTGCGKSTLLRLLLGFENPEKGSIFYDKKNIERLDKESLRKKIGVVMQDGKLFIANILQNIIISAPQLSVEEAWEAAEIAHIADDIRKMPMGMNTFVSEGGGGLSGGQKQRIMIARAVAPKPKVLMFDEATSALDNTTQRLVTEAIDAMKCTRIVIAHRLSTIKHADRIIVLDKGSIIEEGTYDELIKKQGFFNDLVKRQMVEE